MNNAIELYNQAVARLDYVNEELNRPEEDVIAFAVCQLTKEIISDLLGAFLMEKNKLITGEKDMLSLGKLSSEFDDRIAKINFEMLECNPGNTHDMRAYCMDLTSVSSCVKIANELKEIVGGNLTLR